jgi:hypothetical protein
MATRIQIVIDEDERERFRREAERMGVTLSAWLREAAREKLRAGAHARSLRSREALQAFFTACDEREGDAGPEPDWREHRAVIERSIRSGTSGT